MNPLAILAALAALVAVATLLGLIWRVRQGKVTAGSGETITAADLASDAPLGASATLVQFSAELCSRCPGTRRMLSTLAADRPGVEFLDVDLTHRADMANRFNIMQTPTTFILDRSGRIRARIGGVPNRDSITEQLNDLTGRNNVRIAA
ncbi:MAG: thioredoxin family protein [Microbacteriaceae bacterium]